MQRIRSICNKSVTSHAYTPLDFQSLTIQGQHMSIIRKRSASSKAYLPVSTRENHYLLAEFPLSQQLINLYANHEFSTPPNYGDLYQKISALLFSLSQKYEIKNSLFIANDKLARVRFSDEMHQWHTNQQVLFYYNPAYHELQKSFYDASYRAEKVTLLFLATGTEIRVNAASFHARVGQLLRELEQTLQVGKLGIRLRDHQHLTYDIFTSAKGNNETRAHKLRPINARYSSQRVCLPEHCSQMVYATVNIPVNNHLVRLAEIDLSSKDPYNPLYTLISDAFTQASKHYNLNNAALIANGLIPVVRKSEHDTVSTVGELQLLGYNVNQPACGIVCKWDAKILVDNIQLIFVVDRGLQSEQGYAHFLNQIEKAITLMTTELEIPPHSEEIIVRFHQHIAYNMD
jgi:Protein of unknown function (DUF3083)